MPFMQVLLAAALVAQPAAQPAAQTLLVPDFRDLRLTLGATHFGGHEILNTYWFKGARQRFGAKPADIPSGGPQLTRIFECDLKTMMLASGRERTFFTFPLGSGGFGRPPYRIAPSHASKADVTITIDAQDTGERRFTGSYETRHIKTAITVVPGLGTVTRASSVEIDGWYIDLPGLDCQSGQPTNREWALRLAGGYQPHDRLVFKEEGTAPIGFAVEETSTRRSEGNVIINKVRLVSISERPLRPSWFEAPKGFEQVAPPRGMLGLPPRAHD